MTQQARYRVALHTVADPDDVDQGRVCSQMRSRVEECGAEIVDPRNPNVDALVVLVLHGNSARQIVGAAEVVSCPCVVWAARERWAWPSGSLAVGRLREDGRPVRLIYGQPTEEDVVREFGVALRAAFAVKQFEVSRIGVIGGLYPNLVSCACDRTAIASKLGMGMIDIPFDAVRRAMEAIPDGEVESSAARVMADYAAGAELQGVCEAGMRLHLAMRGLARAHGLHGFAVECWSGFPRELGMNPCLGFIDDDYIMACEGDIQLAAGHILARAITGVYPYAGDIYDLDDRHVLTLNHCGAPMSLATGGPSVVQESMPARDLGFRTLVCRPSMATGSVTLLRMHGKACEHLHMAAGELVSVGSLDRMTVRVQFAGDTKHFVENCTGNHYVVAPGDVTDEIRQFCKWKSIDLVET